MSDRPDKQTTERQPYFTDREKALCQIIREKNDEIARLVALLQRLKMQIEDEGDTDEVSD